MTQLIDYAHLRLVAPTDPRRAELLRRCFEGIRDELATAASDTDDAVPVADRLAELEHALELLSGDRT